MSTAQAAWCLSSFHRHILHPDALPSLLRFTYLRALHSVRAGVGQLPPCLLASLSFSQHHTDGRAVEKTNTSPEVD